MAARWLVEEGIGEERALLYKGDRVIGARLRWPGTLEAGQVDDAVLVSKARGASRGRARFPCGEEALVDRLPGDAVEGASIRLHVTRAALDERLRRKPAQARPTDSPVRAPPGLAAALAETGHSIETVRRLPRDDWEEVWGQAWNAACDFAGGSLWFAPTAAMTLIDIDGSLPPRELALAAVEHLASHIARFDLNGSIGIDFPTLATRADRRAVDDALDVALAGWSHERTAMNGFGFVQLVSRLERPSLLHRLSHARAAAAARLVLRRAEEVSAPGALLITAHPAVVAAIAPAWLEELTRRSGREVRVVSEAALAFDGAFAQAIVR